MKEIPLRNKGRIAGWAQVDDEDYARLIRFKWNLLPSKTGYAAYATRCGQGKRTIYMHHEMLPLRAEFDVSHEDGNGLNNQRYNLAYKTHSANCLNRGDLLRSVNRSGIRGVYCDATSQSRNKWIGRFSVGPKTYRTKRCATRDEAAAALSALLSEAAIA